MPVARPTLGFARLQPAPAIALEQVSLSFGPVSIFENLSLTFPAGKTTCILGPSGCGKSSLLKIIAGIQPFDSGRCATGKGHSLTGQVAWMGQKDLLLEWLPLVDNLLLGARLRGESIQEKQPRALELLAAAGLADSAHELPSRLSGGMRQRGALLRTLMEDRPVLLMDEPFSALDALTRMRLQNLAAQLTEGATVVLVTHDPLEALRLGHDIIVLTEKPATKAIHQCPSGNPPRNPGDHNLAEQHAALLALLMNGDGP